jgi:cobalt/nickel transport system permease protein
MAHIPDGFLSAPVIVGTTAVSAIALSIAVRRSRLRLEEREAPLLGAATAFVFAAQMLNFPLGAGTSAHLLGAVLVAVLVGPWSGMLVMFAVLLVQSLLFQDGGIAALGANTLNVAVIAVGVGFLLYRWVLALVGAGSRRRVVAAGVAAFLSANFVGIAVAVELAVSDTVPLIPALVAVGGGHLLVGIGEGVLTGAILAMLLRSRPELVTTGATTSAAVRGWAYSAALASAVLAVVAVYMASARPDVLEGAAERLGIADSAGSYLTAPFANYVAPVGGAWIAAVLGVGLIFLVVWIFARVGARRRAQV